MEIRRRKPRKRGPVQFPDLASVTRPTVPTDHAAYYLNKQPNTLRMWHSLGRGPITPAVLYGKLYWSVAEIRRLVGAGA